MGKIWGTTGAGCVLGASDSDVSECFAYVSIFSGFRFIPDSLRSRTPGLVFLATKPDEFTVVPFRCSDVFADANDGGDGRAVEGGGCSGGGSGFSFSCAAIDGSTEASATVDNEVPADVGFEPNELTQVLPENPL